MALLLDGGLGHLLKVRGLRVDHLSYDQQFLAGALANLEAAGKVQDCHAEYLRAGCSVITTNTFVCTPFNLAKIGREADIAQMIQAAVECAAAARAACSSSALIAGSVPPLQESSISQPSVWTSTNATGQHASRLMRSYQTKGLGSDQELLDSYTRIVDALAPGVDVLLCETLSTVQEVRCACQAASQAGKPVWVSASIDDTLDTKLRSGEALQDAVRAAVGACPTLQAFLVNCCAPAAVTAALPVLQSCLPPGMRFGGYANGFKTTTSQWLTGAATADVPVDEGDYDSDGVILVGAYRDAASKWLAQGATIVGGCCGVGPEHMRAVACLLARD